MDEVRICPICSDEAPPDTFHAVHYGGHSCFGCRAFFRRASQGSREQKYKCKREGNCTITPKSQQLCKRCRYDKCLKAGMNPKKVLTDEEKKVRFSHFYDKRQKKLGAAANLQDHQAQPRHRRRGLPVSTSSTPRRILPRPSATDTSMTGGESTLQFTNAPGGMIQFIIQNQTSSQQNQILPAANIIPIPSSSQQESIVPISLVALPVGTSEQIVGTDNVSITSQSAPIGHESIIGGSLLSNLQPLAGTSGAPSILYKLVVQPSTTIQQNFESETVQIGPSFLPSANATPVIGSQQNGQFFIVNVGTQVSQVQSEISQLSLKNSDEQNSNSNQMMIENGQLMQAENHIQIRIANSEESQNPIPTTMIQNEDSITSSLEPKFVQFHVSQPRSSQRDEVDHHSEDDDRQQCSSSSSVCESTQDHHHRPSYAVTEHNPQTITVVLNTGKQFQRYQINQEPTMSECVNEVEPMVTSSDQNSTSENLFKEEQFMKFLQQKTGRSKFYAMSEFKISTVIDAFTVASGKICLDSERSREMIVTHLRLKSPEVRDLIDQLSSVAIVFRDFALSLNTFSSLNEQDRMLLLRRNIPLYLQYTIARYFAAKSGIDQINWILQGQLLFVEQSESSFNIIGLNDYFKSNNFFQWPELVSEYQEMSEMVSYRCPITQHLNGIVANMILFFCDESVLDILLEPEKVENTFEESKDLFLECLMKNGVQIQDDFNCLFDDLKRMKLIFDDCRIDQSDRWHESDIPRSIITKYNESEEDWMNFHFRKFEEQQMAVSLPSEIFNAMIDYTLYGQTPFDQFFETCYAILTERNRKAIQKCPEFSSLSFSNQDSLWRKNNAAASALSCLRVNALKTGKEQLKFAMGILDTNNTAWEHQFRDSYDLDNLKSCYLHYKELKQESFDENSLKYFLEILAELSNLVANEHIYKLFTLLTLLDTEGLPSSDAYTGIVQLRQIYLKSFHRRLTAAGCSFVDYAAFRKTQKKIKVFASLLESFLA